MNLFNTVIINRIFKLMLKETINSTDLYMRFFNDVSSR